MIERNTRLMLKQIALKQNSWSSSAEELLVPYYHDFDWYEANRTTDKFYYDSIDNAQWEGMISEI